MKPYLHICIYIYMIKGSKILRIYIEIHLYLHLFLYSLVKGCWARKLVAVKGPILNYHDVDL